MCALNLKSLSLEHAKETTTILRKRYLKLGIPADNIEAEIKMSNLKIEEEVVRGVNGGKKESYTYIIDKNPLKLK